MFTQCCDVRTYLVMVQNVLIFDPVSLDDIFGYNA
jgi:hypothetical protein